MSLVIRCFLLVLVGSGLYFGMYEAVVRVRPTWAITGNGYSDWFIAAMWPCVQIDSHLRYIGPETGISAHVGWNAKYREAICHHGTWISLVPMTPEARRTFDDIVIARNMTTIRITVRKILNVDYCQRPYLRALITDVAAP